MIFVVCKSADLREMRELERGPVAGPALSAALRVILRSLGWIQVGVAYRRIGALPTRGLCGPSESSRASSKKMRNTHSYIQEFSASVKSVEVESEAVNVTFTFTINFTFTR